MKKSIQKVLVVLLAVVMSAVFLVPESYAKAAETQKEDATNDFNEFEAWSPTLKELEANAKQVDLLKNYQVKLKPGDACYYKLKIHKKGTYRITYKSNNIDGYTKFYLFDRKIARHDADIYVWSPNVTRYHTQTFSTQEYYIVFRSMDGTGTFNFRVDYYTVPKISCSKLVLLKGKTSRRLFITQNTERPIWSVGNSSVATVATKGAGSAEVTGKKYGTTYVTAIVDGKKIKCKVQIVDPKLNKTSLKLKAKKSYKLKVKQGIGTVRWRSSKNSVARVINGKVTARKKGTAYITATCNGRKMRCKVTVK